VTAIRNPAELPHKDLGVDIALECTGLFTAKDKAIAHLEAGARRVLVSAPCDSADRTIVYGVNHDTLTKDDVVVSNASCTTNCLAPVAKVLHDAVGIDKGMMTTIHSYTGDQPTLDTMHKDLYRARAAALSMIPTSTGAAKAVGLVLPSAMVYFLESRSGRCFMPHMQAKRWLLAHERQDLLQPAGGDASEGALHG
jgi:glyceraldehyde 3-phosphate dehydrogenase